jgi:hypothetical protein
VGGIVTLGLGAVTVWSGLDTLDAADEYEQQPTAERYDEGIDLELRTNLLIVGTSVVGVASILVAAFGTDWGGDDDEASSAWVPALSVGPAGAAIGCSATF